MKPTAEQRAHLANQQAAAHFARHDPLRVALLDLLKPVTTDDAAILEKVKELLSKQELPDETPQITHPHLS